MRLSQETGVRAVIHPAVAPEHWIQSTADATNIAMAEEADEYLRSLLNKNLRITTTDSRLFWGQFKCTDPVYALVHVADRWAGKGIWLTNYPGPPLCLRPPDALGC